MAECAYGVSRLCNRFSCVLLTLTFQDEISGDCKPSQLAILQYHPLILLSAPVITRIENHRSAPWHLIEFRPCKAIFVPLV